MNYEELNFLPRLNGVTILGDKCFEDYGLVPMNTHEIAEIELEIFGYLL